MKSEQRIFSKENGWVIKSDNNLCETAQLVFLFGNKDLLKSEEYVDYVRAHYPVAEVVGCSTSGEILQEEVFSNTIICTAVWFEDSTVKVVKENIDSMEASFEIGEKIAHQLPEKDLVHVMILSEGLNINGSELTKGVNARFGNKVSVTGGLAGDEANFQETVIVHNQAGESNLVLAIGFYGSRLKVGFGSMGGWDSFGVDRLVTRSQSNILYELDGQPALELYKKYLGDHAANLPSSALLFPLSLRMKNSETPIVRTILSVNDDDGSMVFAGDIPQGEYVRLMKANFDRLIEGDRKSTRLNSSH